MENNILCPRCNYSSQKPIFHCMRCGRKLLKDVTVEGTQIVLRFEGDLVKSLAVFYQGRPAGIKLLDITGPQVLLSLMGDINVPQETLSLFEVLNKGEELWEIR